MKHHNNHGRKNISDYAGKKQIRYLLINPERRNVDRVVLTIRNIKTDIINYNHPNGKNGGNTTRKKDIYSYHLVLLSKHLKKGTCYPFNRTFNKPQLVGKIIYIDGNPYKIIK